MRIHVHTFNQLIVLKTKTRDLLHAGEISSLLIYVDQLLWMILPDQMSLLLFCCF